MNTGLAERWEMLRQLRALGVAADRSWKTKHLRMALADATAARTDQTEITPERTVGHTDPGGQSGLPGREGEGSSGDGGSAQPPSFGSPVAPEGDENRGTNSETSPRWICLWPGICSRHRKTTECGYCVVEG